eukprot:3937437-Rhodomonas_salina.1
MSLCVSVVRTEPKCCYAMCGSVWCYATCGTEIAYGASREECRAFGVCRGHVSYLPTHMVLCDVQY